jgi:hypothetical protein
MKKVLLIITAVALVVLMTSSVYAVPICVPKPDENCPLTHCPGLTPGFWKHNLEVYLDQTNGAYSAAYGTTMSGSLMLSLLNKIKTGIGFGGTTAELAQDLLDTLKLPGWSTDRTNAANWFNYLMGFAPY